MKEADNCVPKRKKVQRKNLTDIIIPVKSKIKYKKSYDRFISWKSENNVSNISQDVLLDYFKNLHVVFKPSSLWNEYSMLKSMLNKCEEIDISEYTKLIAYLKNVSEGYEVKKAKTFCQKDIEKFIDEAPDYTYLLYKVAVIFGVLGACKRKELHKLQIKDIDDSCDSKTLTVSIMNEDKIVRQFTITGKYYDICMKYVSLRPDDCDNPGFFVRYYTGRCSSQNVGINSFGSMGKILAKFLKLPNPDLYTGNCFRRTGRLVKTLNDSETVEIYASGAPKSLVVHVPPMSQLQEQGELHAQAGPSRESRTAVRQTEPDSADTSSNPDDPLSTKQCRFCGEFNADCVEVTSDKPYLVHNRTAITLNSLSVDLDFNTLPNAVCPHCDEKLHDIYNFVNQVKTAQDNLINVEANREEIDIKTEALSPTPEDDKEGLLDLVTVGETEFVKPVFSLKRKNDSELNKPKDKVVQKKLKVAEKNIEFFTDVKEEVDMDENSGDQMENSEFSDTGTDVKPSELELNSALRNTFSDSFS